MTEQERASHTERDHPCGVGKTLLVFCFAVLLPLLNLWFRFDIDLDRWLQQFKISPSAANDPNGVSGTQSNLLSSAEAVGADLFKTLGNLFLVFECLIFLLLFYVIVVLPVCLLLQWRDRRFALAVTLVWGGLGTTGLLYFFQHDDFVHYPLATLLLDFVCGIIAGLIASRMADSN